MKTLDYGRWLGSLVLTLLLLTDFTTLFSAQPTPTALPDPVLIGAGDIAYCGIPGGAANSGAELTARIIEDTPGTVFTVGDNAYTNGTSEEFTTCYNPTWGRFKDRTWPVTGNHDYASANATPYYDYFGSKAGEAGKGYYSYDIGEWHIIVLNSNLYAEPQQAQEQWLRDDLESSSAFCTLALWHHPLFSSGTHGNNDYVAPLYQILYDAGADIVINGHDHIYERFAPQDATGQLDPKQGIREFVVGTGGAPLYPFLFLKANSEVRDNSTFGVLKLTLHTASYDWEFIPVAADGFTDTGSTDCHP